MKRLDAVYQDAESMFTRIPYQPLPHLRPAADERPGSHSVRQTPGGNSEVTNGHIQDSERDP